MQQSTDENDSQQEDLNRYQVTSRREIATILRTLAEKKQLVRMQINNGADNVTTSVLGIDEANGLMVIDCARSTTMNNRIVDSDQIDFETTLDNIRILFSAAQASACEYDGLPAFAMGIPASMIRLQRREYYRVPTPIANPVRCTIHIPNDHGAIVQTLNLTLQNVSGGGVAIVDEGKQLDDTIGRVYKDCRIDLPGGTLVIATLEIRNSHEIKLNNGKTVRRLGCLFVDLPNPMLSAVQRYITKLERDQNARNMGMK